MVLFLNLVPFGFDQVVQAIFVTDQAVAHDTFLLSSIACLRINSLNHAFELFHTA
jgi:hypothetical protein